MKIEQGVLQYIYRDKPHSIFFKLEEDQSFPGITLKASIKKLSKGFRIIIDLQSDEAIQIKEAALLGHSRYDKDDLVNCNGFQSWTDSREFTVKEKMKKLFWPARLRNVHYFGEYHFYNYSKRKGKLHSYNYCYIRSSKDSFRFSGSLSEDEGYTIYEINTKKHTFNITKDCTGLVVKSKINLFDIINLFGNEDEVFSEYFKTMNVNPPKAPYCTGWTSWYNYYTNISEEIILQNLEAFKEKNIPIDTFQIDDGYQTAVGDWLSIKSSFPNGMGHIAKEIKKCGYKAGLWLAPFVCEINSKIFEDHKNWLLYDENGKPVPAGWNHNWSGNFYCLDIYNKEFLAYLKEVFNTVLKDWKFDMVKLDFLYGAAQVPRRGKTRGMIMADAWKLLRQLVGKKTILGCGTPMGQAFGNTEYCRIGSDVALKWEDKLLNKINYRERVSTINSLNSTIGRYGLNKKAFLNDPDVFILRKENNKLNENQKFTLFILNNIFGGLIFTSDNINTYSEAMMNLYSSSFPFKEKDNLTYNKDGDFYKIKFNVGKNLYIVYGNLTGKKRKVILDKGNFYYYDHKKDKSEFFNSYKEIEIFPYQTVCLLQLEEKPTTIAGSTGHLFPGSEIESVTIRGNKINIKIHGHCRNKNRVFIRVSNNESYSINDNDALVEEIFENVFIASAII